MLHNLAIRRGFQSFVYTPESGLTDRRRSTYKLTWEDIVALYRLTLDAPPHNLRPRYNVCPTTTIDTVVAHDGKRDLVPMRWGLVPNWWSKPLKELRLAAFNARAETVATKDDSPCLSYAELWEWLNKLQRKIPFHS